MFEPRNFLVRRLAEDADVTGLVVSTHRMSRVRSENCTIFESQSFKDQCSLQRDQVHSKFLIEDHTPGVLGVVLSTAAGFPIGREA